jgi:hypothetical protein
MAETPDLSALTTSFLKFGGQVFRKNVNEFAPTGVLVFKNVKKPIALTKLSAQGGPRPYRAQDDTSGNGAKFTDRILNVYQSKWDFDVDPEKYRNTYLAEESQVPFYQYILDQISKEYLASINDNVALAGVYDASGSDAVDIATGWGTLLKAAATAGDITAVTTGAIHYNNAVMAVEKMAKSMPLWARKRGFQVKCSYHVFDKYKEDYRTRYGFTFEPTDVEGATINGFKARLVPESWMGSGDFMIATVDNNLVMGTDGDSMEVAASMRRNIIEVRPMMPIGFQIQDLDGVKINEQGFTDQGS